MSFALTHALLVSYESWIIYNFLTLCYAYVGGPGQVVTAQDGKSVHPSCVHGTCCLPSMQIDGFFLRGCKQGALQFVIIKPILAFLSLFLDRIGLYADGEFRADRGYGYLAFMYNVCYTVALYGLLLFYVAAADLLEPHKPILKFVVVKSVVFFTFWQSLACSLMVNLGILYDGEEARKLQNFLICVEMVLASFGLIFAFPYTAYYQGAPDSFMDAIYHAASVHDVYSDIVHQFAGRYGDYVLYSEDTEAAPKRHYIRARMDAAMLAAALAVKQGADVVKEGRLGEVMRDGVLDGVNKVNKVTREVVNITKEGRLGEVVFTGVKGVGEGMMDGVNKVSHGVVDGVHKLDAFTRSRLEPLGNPIAGAFGFTPGGHHGHSHQSGGSGGKAGVAAAAGVRATRTESYDSPMPDRRRTSADLEAAARAGKAAMSSLEHAGESGDVEMAVQSTRVEVLGSKDATEAAARIDAAWRSAMPPAPPARAASQSQMHAVDVADPYARAHLARLQAVPPAPLSPPPARAPSPPRAAVAVMPASCVTDADFEGVGYAVHAARQKSPPKEPILNAPPLTHAERAWSEVPVEPLQELPAHAAAQEPLAEEPAAALAAAFEHPAFDEPPPPPPPPPPAAAGVSRRAALLALATAPPPAAALENEEEVEEQGDVSGDDFLFPLPISPPSSPGALGAPPAPPEHPADDNPFG